MSTLYWLSVSLHILAATAWIGGMFFLVLVVVPWLRRGGRAQAPSLLRDTGRRFRSVGWICFGILLVTGVFNLWFRGVRLQSFVDPRWLMGRLNVLLALALVGVAVSIVRGWP